MAIAKTLSNAQLPRPAGADRARGLENGRPAQAGRGSRRSLRRSQHNAGQPENHRTVLSAHHRSCPPTKRRRKEAREKDGTKTQFSKRSTLQATAGKKLLPSPPADLKRPVLGNTTADQSEENAGKESGTTLQQRSHLFLRDSSYN